MNYKYIITKVEDNLICALYCDSVCHYLKVIDNGSILNNIYIGRVENVVNNINAAFVEIKAGIKGFYSLENKTIFLNQKNNNKVNIGDRILVSVSSDAHKTKPCTLCSKLTITGKMLVLTNDVKSVYVSKKIKSLYDSSVIEKLIDIVKKFNERIKADYNISNVDAGFIIRTSSVNASTEELFNEANSLLENYEDMIRKSIYGVFYSLVYEEKPEYFTDIIHYLVNDNFEVITDIKKIYNSLEQSFNNVNIRYYEDDFLPLYKLYSVEKELKSALSKKIWLKSGGYLIIEQTEALTVIDVNTGKNTKKAKNDEAALKSFHQTNEEAAAEIMKQLKLRNISGIIIIDFINTNSEYDNMLMSELKKLAKKDTVLTTIVDITKLGLVEITRKRNGKSLKELIRMNNDDEV